MRFERAGGQWPIIRIDSQNVRNATAFVVVAAYAVSIVCAIQPADFLHTIRHGLRRFNEQPLLPVSAAIERGSKVREVGWLETSAAKAFHFQDGFDEKTPDVVEAEWVGVWCCITHGFSVVV